MKKILLTELQAGKLIKSVADAENPYALSDGRYHQKVKIDFIYYGGHAAKTYKGGEIDDISEIESDVSFLIKIEDDIQGIKGLKIYDVRGPKEIEAKIRYFSWDSDPNDINVDPIDEPIKFVIPWQSIRFEESSNLEYFGIGDTINLRLQNDPDGGLMVREVEVEIKSFN